MDNAPTLQRTMEGCNPSQRPIRESAYPPKKQCRRTQLSPIAFGMMPLCSLGPPSLPPPSRSPWGAETGRSSRFPHLGWPGTQRWPTRAHRLRIPAANPTPPTPPTRATRAPIHCPSGSSRPRAKKMRWPTSATKSRSSSTHSPGPALTTAASSCVPPSPSPADRPLVSCSAPTPLPTNSSP